MVVMRLGSMRIERQDTEINIRKVTIQADIVGMVYGRVSKAREISDNKVLKDEAYELANKLGLGKTLLT